MSLASALSIALSGLRVSTSQLQLASSNISNAHVAGYTEKTAVVSAVSVGADNGGSEIAGYTRATNDVLSAAYNGATADASYLGTQSGYMKQVQSLLDSTATNPTISNDISQFQSAWTQYAAAPENPAQQQAVIQAGNTLASDIKVVSSGVVALQKQVNSDIQTNVTSLNNSLAQVAKINEQISTALGQNQPAGNLQDQRDQLINSISSIAAVTIMPRANGQIALYAPSGTLLLDGATPQTFSFDGTNILSPSGQNVTTQLTGGSLQAQTQFVANSSPSAASTAPGSEVIRKLSEQLSALVGAFTSTSTTGSISTYSSAPSAFKSAYDTTSPAADSGSQATNFFTVSYDTNGNAVPGSFAVNPNLVNGTASVRQTNVAAIAASFTSSADYTASGLSAKGATYAQLATAILSNFQQSANTINTSSTAATQQQSYYQQSLSSATGVNIDDELVQLTTLQNSYAASAHVITTISQMLSALEAAVQ